MLDFWWFARRLLRRRSEVLLVLLGAAISTGGIGAGLLSLGPVLRLILKEGDRLDQPAGGSGTGAPAAQVPRADRSP
jgi:hypothetical protein